MNFGEARTQKSCLLILYKAVEASNLLKTYPCICDKGKIILKISPDAKSLKHGINKYFSFLPEKLNLSTCDYVKNHRVVLRQTVAS